MKFRRPNLYYLEGELIQPSNVHKARVEEFAQQISKMFDYKVGGEIHNLVEKMAGRIHYQHLDEWINESGSIFVHGEFDFDILLPVYTSPRRDCFTVAHELGHYFLHSDLGKTPIIAYRKGSTRIEWEANWFAASLLMPADPFRIACQKTQSLATIANAFGVSEDAARIRKQSLEI